MTSPIHEVFETIKETLDREPIVILESPPGTGKSTVLPLLLLESQVVKGKILLLQPRRIAARMVAHRLADQLGQEVGQQIGYSVRFESKKSQQTQLEVITEGLLLRRLQTDQLLDGVDLVIFDEFHERSLEADFSIALLREVQQIMRPDLKLLIMSATLAIGDLKDSLPDAPIISLQVTRHPLEIVYSSQPLPTVYDFQRCVDDAVSLIKRALNSSTGHILVFLPGQREINAVEDRLNAVNSNGYYTVYPLYAELSVDRQRVALTKSASRKVILATSIAETSLTIDGVDTVIDTGWSRRSRYNPKSGLTTLETVLVTQDAATQRAGRAARQQAGIAYRTWTVNQHQLLEPTRPLPVLSNELSSIVLQSTIWGSPDSVSLPWITYPSRGLWDDALKLLIDLRLVTANKKVTSSGTIAASYPCHPRLGAMLARAQEADLLRFMPELVVLAEERLNTNHESVDVWYALEFLSRNPNKSKNTNDLIDRWHNLLKTKPAHDYPHELMGRALSWAYPDRVAKRLDNTNNQYKLANGQTVKLHNDPITASEWLVIVESDGLGRVSKAATIQPEVLNWLVETSKSTSWDAMKERVTNAETERIGQLVLSIKHTYIVSDNEAIPILIEEVSKRRWQLLTQPEDLDNWLARISSLRFWAPELSLPQLDEEVLFDIASLEKWLASALNSKRSKEDLRRLDISLYITQLLDYEQQSALDKLAPKAFKVPTGSQIKINYKQDGDAPILSVRLQELFGQTITPTILNGRIKLTLELLSPGYKPVQTTQDLISFWNNAYHEVKKELKRRYPKHSWPDNPFEAEPVRGVKKRPT